MTAVVASPAAGRSQEPAPGARIFAEHASRYRAAGWVNVFPLPRGRKSAPPGGVTGGGRFTPSGADLAEWAAMMPRGNIAIGMPRDVAADGSQWDIVGVDVDDYEKGGITKTGLATIARFEAETGVAFPPTVKITSRGDDPSGKYLYRIPAGVELVSNRPSVELLQHWHRYAVAPPSTNPDSGGTEFEWRTGARPARDCPGVRTRRTPRPQDAAVLPAELTAHLTRDTARGTPLDIDRDEWRRFFATLPGGIGGIPCGAVRRLFVAASAAARGRTGESRHDETLRNVLRLLRLGEQGHLGAGDALKRLADVYAVSVGDRATEPAARDEYLRMIGRRAVGLVLAEPTDPDERQCLCPEGIAAAFATVPDPAAAAREVGIHIPSVIARIDHPRARAVVAAHLGGVR